MINLAMLALTAFISVNGQLVEVEKDSAAYENYMENAVTDIGDPVNLLTDTVEDIAETPAEGTDGTGSVADPASPTATPAPEATPEPAVVVVDNEEEVALLTTAVELLAENSDTATGTLNSSVLTLMDRMIDSYPSFMKYAGFRTSEDDSYMSTLYISKRAEVSGYTITFGSDCIAIDFARQTTNNGYSGYIYYTVTDSPNASVNVNSGTIVYTNCMKGYPSLGSKPFVQEHWYWVALFAVFVLFILNRRKD